MSYNIPVLLLTFNRIEVIDKLVDSLRLVKPNNIFIASDGPRASVVNEDFLVQSVRDKLLREIDWECEISTLFRDENLGCKLGVSSAVKWFFNQVHKGIVLEDDCIPSLAFYEYCEQLLDKYEFDSRIGSISGRNELGVYGNEPIIFSTKFNCWGWASWADRILPLNVEYGYKASDIINFSHGSFAEKLHIKTIRSVMLNKQVNSWAFPFDFGFRNKNQLCIVPQFNMISNIGFGEDGTHSTSRTADGIERYAETHLNSISDEVAVMPNHDYVKKLILSLYSWPKLLLLSNIGLLYPLRPLYRKARKSIKKI